ncbi:MAG: hypothetical protein ACW98Y_11775 [Candidatus Thorarchaeota archaeon]|jgi:hypothetical protein
MNRFQVTLILGIGLLCATPTPFLLPRATYVGSVIPSPFIASVMIALAGVIVLVLAVLWKLKPVPAYGK